MDNNQPGKKPGQNQPGFGLVIYNFDFHFFWRQFVSLFKLVFDWIFILHTGPSDLHFSCLRSSSSEETFILKVSFHFICLLVGSTIPASMLMKEAALRQFDELGSQHFSQKWWTKDKHCCRRCSCVKQRTCHPFVFNELKSIVFMTWKLQQSMVGTSLVI